MEIDSKQKFEAVKALMEFAERKGFDDFFYDLDTTSSGNITYYMLSLLDRQRKSVFDIVVKIVSTSEGETCEVDIKGNNVVAKEIAKDAILEAISENINAYKAKQIGFLEKLSNH